MVLEILALCTQINFGFISACEPDEDLKMDDIDKYTLFLLFFVYQYNI